MRRSLHLPKIVALLLALLVASPLAARTRDRSATRQKLAGPVRATGPQSSTRLLPWGRTLDPNHPLRRQVQPEALLRATLGLLGGNDIATLPRHVRAALSKKAGKAPRSLRQRRTQLALIDTLRRAVKEERFEQIAGSQAAGLKAALEQLNTSWGPADHKDMQRGWGFQLLPKNDKAFADPTFLARMLRESGQTGHGLVHNEPTGARYVFDAAWGKVAPQNVRPISFTLTGSDANNSLYSIAKVAAERRLGKQVDSAELLYLDGVYGGGRGKIAGMSFLHYGKDGAPDLSAYKIDSPHTAHGFKPKAKAEIARLEKIEAQALAQIEQKVASSAKPIGGLLLEPVLGAKGVYFYRPEFLTKLRALCDKLQVPIMADEVLTGGGRTGKFFAYQHYTGFEPDFVTFGKGLQVAGVAQVSRRASFSVWAPGQMTTLNSYSEPLLKGAQVLTRIHEGKLMENAAQVGAHIVKQLRAYQQANPQDFRDKDGPVRGLGMLIFSRVRPSGVMDAMGRLMPPLTLTKAEADQVFSPKELATAY